MIELTEEQREELNTPEPLTIDPRTREMYVLVRKEAYERLKALLSLDEYSAEEGAGYVKEIMAEDDANDSFLESYQHFLKSPP